MLPGTQSIQSARLSVQSSALGPPLTHPQASVAPSKVGDTLACGRGGGGDPIPTKRSDTLVLHVLIPRRYTPVVGVSDEPYSAKPLS
jgi:hypothetical protein